MRTIILIMIMALVGCIRGPGYNTDSAESLGIYLGHFYTVKSGFYKDCVGMAISYSDMTYNDDTVMLKEVTCPNVTANFISTEAKNLKK